MLYSAYRAGRFLFLREESHPLLSSRSHRLPDCSFWTKETDSVQHLQIPNTGRVPGARPPPSRRVTWKGDSNSCGTSSVPPPQVSGHHLLFCLFLLSSSCTFHSHSRLAGRCSFRRRQRATSAYVSRGARAGARPRPLCVPGLRQRAQRYLLRMLHVLWGVRRALTWLLRACGGHPLGWPTENRSVLLVCLTFVRAYCRWVLRREATFTSVAIGCDLRRPPCGECWTQFKNPSWPTLIQMCGDDALAPFSASAFFLCPTCFSRWTRMALGLLLKLKFSV